MKRNDIVIGVITVVIIAVVLLLLRQSQSPPVLQNPNPSPSSQQQIEDAFNLEIPDDVEKIDLEDVADIGGVAIATRKFENGEFTSTVLADLPDPIPGSFYQVWITKDDPASASSQFLSLGRMRLAKGGWILEFRSTTDYLDYNGFLISEEKTSDNSPERHLMQGQF